MGCINFAWVSCCQVILAKIIDIRLQEDASYDKHGQRHNGPEGWLLLTKETSLRHITSSYTNLDQISSSEISTKHQLQNLNQMSAFQLNLIFIMFTKPYFRISTKIKLHSLNQASAAKYWQTFASKSRLNSKSWPNLVLKVWTNFNFQNCTKLSPTRFSASTSATVTPSTSFDMPSSHARVTSIKSTEQHGVS